MQFPSNPNDQDVFTPQPGLSYVYEASISSWIARGGGSTIGLATPLRDGLMSATDLFKLNRVVVPMPETTIRSEACDVVFVAGHISLFNSDDYLDVQTTHVITNKAADLPGTDYNIKLTENTSVVTFAINKDKLVSDLLASGQLNLTGKKGDTGEIGPPGEDGGVLATGAKGPTGDAGVGPPCSISFIPDTLQFQPPTDLNKAIVDLEIRQVGTYQYNLVLKQAVIGNPDAAPSTLSPNCEANSSWVLATDASGQGSHDLYYVDMNQITAAIEAKYVSELARIKAGHESIVAFWMSKMKEVYDTEKSALCCSLFECLKNANYSASLQSTQIQQSAMDPGLAAILSQQPRQIENCYLKAADLAVFEQAWQNGTACSAIIRIANQDYVVVKLPESIASNIKCIADMGNPAIAWPTLNKTTFVKIGNGPYRLAVDIKLNATAQGLLKMKQNSTPGCSFGQVLFPKI